jgi:hypothetical protein
MNSSETLIMDSRNSALLCTERNRQVRSRNLGNTEPLPRRWYQCSLTDYPERMQNIFCAHIPKQLSSPLTGQKIPAFNETQKVHYRALKSPPPVPVLHLINQTPPPPLHCVNIHFNSVLPFLPIILNGLFPAGFSTHNLSFCPSIDLFIPTHCRCRGLLLHFVTFSDTYTR